MSKRGASELWYGIYGHPYEGEEPAFFEGNELPWVSVLKESYPAIKRELAPLMTSSASELTPYFDENLQFPPRNWKTIGFCFWGKKIHENLDRFPAVAALFDRIPGLITVSFNLLEPHSRIKAHYGETNGAFRVHLGIQIPAGLPECGFTVKGESRPWGEGEVMVFLDANTHEAFNNSDARRYILLLDVVRPEFMDKKNFICIKSLSVLTFYWLEAHTRFFGRLFGITSQDKLKNIPRWVMNTMLLPIRLAWSVWLPFHNRFGRNRFGLGRS